MTTFAKQQTIETIRANQDLVDALNRNVDVDAGIAAYRAEKLASRRQHDAHVLRLGSVAAVTIQWLTTAPNPRSPATGVDAGQRGWRLHAIKTDSVTFTGVRFQAALCGLRPRHGWGLDAYIEDRCIRCERALLKRVNN